MTADAHDSERGYRARYSQAMARDAVKTYVFRRLFAEQKGLWVVALAMIAFFIWLLWKGERDWLTGIAGAAAALPFILVIIGWRAHSANTVGRLSRMREPVADISYDDKTLSFTSDLGNARMPWSLLTEVWQRPGYWMIFFDKNQFNILPDENMPEGLRERLRRRAN